MKKAICVCVMFLLLLTGCTSSGDMSSIASETNEWPDGKGGNNDLASVYLIPDLESALSGKTNPNSKVYGEPCVLFGATTDTVIEEHKFGVLREVEVHKVLFGDIDTDTIHVTISFNQGVMTAKQYLMLVRPVLGEEKEYDRIGVRQCIFWVDNGELCGFSKLLVDEINTTAAAKTYAAYGAPSKIDSMEDLEAYFLARVAALEATAG